MEIVNVNDFIVDRRDIIDDGCDYGAVIMNSLNEAARARCRADYIRPPKPIKVAEPAVGSGPVVKIGERASYGRKVMTGVYQLHRLGHSADEIARMLKMPLDRVKHVLKHDTAIRRKLFGEVMSGARPVEGDVMRGLAAESRV
ncbi:hypothetical protein [Sodalis sp. C49]|uniref:hypothetical protein n=1 Tax=Sodalis sp. C49 TaxID=3228929 RepID=UPI003965B176